MKLAPGLNPSLSSPTSEQVCKKRGGQRWYSPSKRVLVTDHRPTGFLTLRQSRPEEILLSFKSSLTSLVTYPPTKWKLFSNWIGCINLFINK